MVEPYEDMDLQSSVSLQQRTVKHRDADSSKACSETADDYEEIDEYEEIDAPTITAQNSNTDQYVDVCSDSMLPSTGPFDEYEDMNPIHNEMDGEYEETIHSERSSHEITADSNDDDGYEEVTDN